MYGKLEDADNPGLAEEIAELHRPMTRAADAGTGGSTVHTGPNRERT
jgi:hypothetical protein